MNVKLSEKLGGGYHRIPQYCQVRKPIIKMLYLKQE